MSAWQRSETNSPEQSHQSSPIHQFTTNRALITKRYVATPTVNNLQAAADVLLVAIFRMHGSKTQQPSLFFPKETQEPSYP
jgi:hypothetical protein